MLREIVEHAKHIVFFGGAGVSTASGIPDYRSKGGLYDTDRALSPERMLSHSYFMRHPEEFFDFYKNNLLYPDAEPNDAHRALAELERRKTLSAVVTQNVDGLHQKAGSHRVIELHGSALRNYCMRCKTPYDMQAVIDAPGVPLCHCGGIIRPDVVLYEEQLDDEVVSEATSAIARSDVLIVGGTSLAVYPAASLVRYFQGDDLVLINRDPTDYDSLATLIIRDPIDRVLREAVLG